jgi:hypothetical protein
MKVSLLPWGSLLEVLGSKMNNEVLLNNLSILSYIRELEDKRKQSFIMMFDMHFVDFFVIISLNMSLKKPWDSIMP